MSFIGQVDRKFIAVSVPDDFLGRNLFLLFDQHAVHERIRLEDLLKEHFPNQESVKSEEISAITVTFGEPDVRLIRSFKDKFQVFGLQIDYNCDDDDSDKTSVRVTRVPACFVLREENDLRNFRPSPLINLTRSLVQDVVAALRENGAGAALGGGGILPKTLNYVLASRACRGAVKFGDSLSPDRCQQLLRQLGRCQLPFQCAHGRPSLSPLVDLNQLRLCSPQPSATPVNFQKLRELCQMAASP